MLGAQKLYELFDSKRDAAAREILNENIFQLHETVLLLKFAIFNLTMKKTFY